MARAAGTAASSLARHAATAMSIGLAIVFLVFAPRQEIWGWRLALYGQSWTGRARLLSRCLAMLRGHR